MTTEFEPHTHEDPEVKLRRLLAIAMREIEEPGHLSHKDMKQLLADCRIAIAEGEAQPCSICGQPMLPWPHASCYGHNAQPINDGRCCDVCNTIKVVPARMKRMGLIKER